MQERRKVARTRSYVGGRISFNQRCSTMDCLLRNVSTEGALLIVSHTAVLPDRFEVAVPRKERAYSARLVWRREDRAGVSFLGPEATGNVVPLDAALRIRRLEADNLALRRRVAQLSSD